MGFFDTKVLQSAIVMKEAQNEDEWIWVDGYKGTDKDMKCMNYQYELGKKHDMPESEGVTVCRSGFHFCRELKQVFKYYNINHGNRFFKVSALIRQRDLISNDSKFAAKSIIFTEECTIDEIFKSTDVDEGWSIEDKKYAIKYGLSKARDHFMVGKLVQLGFTHEFATLIVNDGRGDIALAVGSQTELSMDTKVLAIFTANSSISNARRSLKNLANSMQLQFPTLNPYVKLGK